MLHMLGRGWVGAVGMSIDIEFFDDLVQGTPQWFDVRRGIVTASVVGKLITPSLKVADNETSRGVTASLVAERITDFTEDHGMTSDMIRGVESEPVARGLYASRNRVRVDEVGFVRRGTPGHNLLGYSPDGLVGKHGLIEIKAPRQKTHLNTILADEVPPQYMAQCQAGLYATDRAWLDFVSYCGGMPLFVKRVFPDERWHDAITDACITYEQNAAALLADYESRVAGLPATERIDFNTIELRLA